MEAYLTFQRQPQSFIDKEYFFCNHYAYLSKQRQDVCPYKFCMMDGNMDRVHFLWFKLKDQSPFFTKTMHAAAQKGRFDIVQLIMDTDPFHIREGLHLAARHGHLPMVQSIMVQMKNSKLGISPFSTATAWHGHFRVSWKYSYDWCGYTPLHLGAKYGHLKIVQFLMEHVEDKYPLDRNGKTPLHLAAEHGRQHIVQFLSANPV